MKVIIYGLGKYADDVSGLLNKTHEIVGYTDSFCKINIYREKPFYKLEDLIKIDFDYIVIGIQDRKVTWTVAQNLIEKYGIAKEKIIPFSIWQESEIVENIRCENDVQGIILGNSHAFYGYLTKFMKYKFINLACQSQGIYYNYRAYQRFMQKNLRGGIL